MIRAVVSCLALSALLASPGLTQPLHDRGLNAVTAGAAAFPDWLPQSLATSLAISDITSLFARCPGRDLQPRRGRTDWLCQI